MDLLERELEIGDERFATPRTYHSATKSYRSNASHHSKSSITPRSSNSDDWKTTSSRSSAFHTDNADYKPTMSRSNHQLDREESFHSVASGSQRQYQRNHNNNSNSNHNRKESTTLSDTSDVSYQANDNDITDIFSYARHGRCEDINQCLSRGVPVDIRDDTGNTMLIIACQNGNKRVIKTVLRNGANINIKNYKGNTPLHYCFHFGYGDTLGEYLISKGADSSLRNNAGRSCWEGI